MCIKSHQKTKIMRLNACVEDLNAMKPSENGRFCSSCNKNIVDLTAKSKEEIQQLYVENNGELCGIVLPNQLEERKYYHPLKRFAFSLMLVFGSALFVFAGDIQPHFDSFRLKILTEVTDVEAVHTIKGFVYAGGQLLIGAEVSVVSGDNVFRSRTDANGQFILELPELKLDEVELIITARGYADTYKHVALTSENLFIGKITLKKVEVEKCVKGKIAPDYKNMVGNIALPDEAKPKKQRVEIQTQGEIEVFPSGGIEPPSDDSIFD